MSNISQKLLRIQEIKENLRSGIKNNLRQNVKGITFEQMGEIIRDTHIPLTVEEEKELKGQWAELLQSKREDLDLGLHDELEWPAFLAVMDRIGNIYRTIVNRDFAPNSYLRSDTYLKQKNSNSPSILNTYVMLPLVTENFDVEIGYDSRRNKFIHTRIEPKKIPHTIGFNFKINPLENFHVENISRNNNNEVLILNASQYIFYVVDNEVYYFNKESGVTTLLPEDLSVNINVIHYDEDNSLIYFGGGHHLKRYSLTNETYDEISLDSLSVTQIFGIATGPTKTFISASIGGLIEINDLFDQATHVIINDHLYYGVYYNNGYLYLGGNFGEEENIVAVHDKETLEYSHALNFSKESIKKIFRYENKLCYGSNSGIYVYDIDTMTTVYHNINFYMLTPEILIGFYHYKNYVAHVKEFYDQIQEEYHYTIQILNITTLKNVFESDAFIFQERKDIYALLDFEGLITNLNLNSFTIIS